MSDAGKVDSSREMLVEAQQQGPLATVKVFTRLSGPGWLQSAITLGGGSLAGSLFLGVLGGTSMIWLQLMAIFMGVIMLSAISYVTLSTGERPFRAINQHINPVLGWGWLIATMMANIIWCMPQFSLCYAALQKNLIGDALEDSDESKFIISGIILVATFIVVQLNRRPGPGLKMFDRLLKSLVGMIVICFFGVVILMLTKGQLDLAAIIAGFKPDLGQFSKPTGTIAEIIAGLSTSSAGFWSARVVQEQRAVMIGAAATAVGINMTFLLPYSMLNRGWDKPFRGLARFDLSTGMAIPYILVTSCVVIASAAVFHAQPADEQLASTDAAVMTASPMFSKVEEFLTERVQHEVGEEAWNGMSETEQQTAMAALSGEEKQLALSLVKRDAFQLSQSLAPLLGERLANIVFGLGVFGMGFSTVIILMLINSYAFCEAIGRPQSSQPYFSIGALIAGLAGAAWPFFWTGDSKVWLAILTSSFGMMLLPIAYITFMMMMNSKSLMKDDKPKGLSMLIWNVLMGFSVVGACAAAWTAVSDKVQHEAAGGVVMAVGIGYVVAVILGFVMKSRSTTTPTSAAEE